MSEESFTTGEEPPPNDNPSLELLADAGEALLVLRVIACLPERLWPDYVQRGIGKFNRLLRYEVVISELLEDHHTDMLVHHYRLGRAAQPTGPLDEMAASVGALRIDAPSSILAADFLGNIVLNAIKNGDGDILQRIANLSKGDFVSHRNFIIWDVIDKLMLEATETVGTVSGGRFVTMTTLPTKKMVKDYVSHQKSAGHYLDFPDDEKGWNRLWKDSGAYLMLRKARKGT